MSNFLKLLIMNKKEIAKALLSAGAVKFFPNPKDAITFKSGIKSPIYRNNREMTKSPDCYNIILNDFMDAVNAMWDEYDSHAEITIVGVPMGALFWASCIAFDFGAGYAFVRQEAKDHGMKTKIDGHPLGEGTKVIIIEDLPVAHVWKLLKPCEQPVLRYWASLPSSPMAGLRQSSVLKMPV